MSPYLLASSLSPADVGRRVVVRFALPDGQASDVLGELASWTDSGLSVRRRDGSVEVIEPRAVLAGKVVPATWARDVATGELQRIASDGWPALERVALGSWELRAAAGWTKRANSVLPIGSPGVPLDEALSTIKSWYEERGLPATLQVPLPLGADLDADLDARGWRAVSPSHVLVADLKGLGQSARGSGVTVTSTPSPEWLAAHPASSGAPPGLLASGHDLFAAITDGTRAAATDGLFAEITDGTRAAALDGTGAVVGVARAAVVEAWLFLNSLWVAESHHRHGLAETLMRALIDAVASSGVRHVFLQVEVDNPAALALYAKLGFSYHHSYVYRVAP